MKLTARAAQRLGVKTRRRLHRLARSGSTSRCSRRRSEEMVDAGYQDFADRWNPILDVFDECGVRFAHEVHPSEIAYDYWTTVRDAGGDRPPGGVRAELGPEPLRLAGPRPGRVPLGLPGPDLPRRLQGREAARSATAATAGSARTCRGPTRGAAGTSSPPATATCRGRQCFRMLNTIGYDGPISVEWEDAGMDRLRRCARGAGVRPAAGLRPAGRRLRRGVLDRQLSRSTSCLSPEAEALRASWCSPVAPRRDRR